MQRSLDYMGLQPHTPLEGLQVDKVFIGSKFSDLLFLQLIIYLSISIYRGYIRLIYVTILLLLLLLLLI